MSAKATVEVDGTADGTLPDAAGEWSAWVEKLVAGQDARKASLEQRGLAVITTSGSLVTLLFGLVAVLTSAKNFSLPKNAHGWLVAALVAFVLAAIAGLVTNWPRGYQVPDLSDRRVVLDRWDEPSRRASRKIAVARMKEYSAAQKINDGKAVVLAFAMSAEVVGVLLLAIAVGKVLAAA